LIIMSTVFYNKVKEFRQKKPRQERRRTQRGGE
jgi:hypothetical protein